MKNIKAIIREDVRKKDKEHLIYIRYTYNRRYILFRTDVYTLKSNWNKQSGRVRKSINSEKINDLLEQMENDIQSLVIDLKLKYIEPTLLNVKNEYYNFQNHTHLIKTSPRKVNEKLFIKDFKAFIQERIKQDEVRQNTIKSYNTTLNKLIEFQKSKKYFLHYNTINETFYYDFVSYLRNDEGLLDNSVDKHIKIIKVFMSYALEKKKHTNVFFQTFKRMRTKTDFMTLERDEILKVAYEYKPKLGSLKDKVRDTFILGCSTGLRISDLTQLSKGNFVIKRDYKNRISGDVRDTYIRLQTEKTNDQLKIPVNNFILHLIKKYDIESQEITFLKINQQVFNRTIKEICKEAGITDLVKLTKRKGTNLVHYQKPKYEFISSHTMRRTFITQLSNSIQISNVQAVSGHKNIKTLNDYVRHNDEELNNVQSNLNEIFYMTETEQSVDYNTIDKVKASVKKSKVHSRLH